MPRIVNSTMENDSHGNKVNPKCLGRPVKALVLDYTSAQGFRGTDTFTATYVFTNGTRDTITYVMTVE
jgi:hypothetical protein